MVSDVLYELSSRILTILEQLHANRKREDLAEKPSNAHSTTSSEFPAFLLPPRGVHHV